MTTTAPSDIWTDLAERKRRGQTAEQLAKVGQRTGWWNDDDVDWLFQDGSNGPRPEGWSLDNIEPLPEVTYDHDAQPIEAPDRNQPVGPSADPESPIPGVTVDVGEPAPTAYVGVVSLDQVFADTYQRDVDHGRVHRMAKHWDRRLVGVIDVSDRGLEAPADRRFAVVAGQHRWLAAMEHGEQHLAATIHEGLTVADEARLMHELDRTQKKLSGFDRWRARRGAADPIVLEVEAIAARHSLRVDAGVTDGILRSYGAAEKLLTAGGPELLDHTLAVLGAAYGRSSAGYIAPLVSGVGQFLRQRADVDLDRLGRALAAVRPEQLRATATQLREFESGTLAELFVRAIARAYDRARTS